MKHLIYFLLFSSVVFSQNFNYAIDEPKKSTVPALPVVNNQLEEIEYFNAYVLPITKKATIQVALDTYGSVRLEKGDYSGVNIVMKSNQKLYGHPTTNGITSITIAAGSTNVRIESLKPAKDSALYITFQAGAETSNCILKNLKYAEISAVNASIINNTFLDIMGKFNFDCSNSGYFRNNRIIKHQSQGNANMVVMKGNRTTPSYGNVNFHNNYLGSMGQTTTIENLVSSTFIGTDCETYDGLSRELLHVNNVDKLKLFVINGSINYNSGFGYFNIDAGDVFSISGGNNDSQTSSVLSPRTNMLNFITDKSIVRSAGTVTGFYAKSYLSQIDRDFFPHFNYNEIDKKTAFTDPAVVSKLTASILGTQYTPWARQTWETLPDPLGANWKAERVGKPDSRAYIQNLIDKNGVADLPEGVFYISATLNVANGAGKGITGKGTGKTVICGLTDNFPLISVTTGLFGNIDLSNLTLQGGSAGLYVSNHPMMMSYQSLKYIIFRDQINGIHFFDLFGLDNNFFEHLSFVNCVVGIRAQPFAGVVNPNDISGSTYLDKNAFYKCEFINCTTGMYLRSGRANNLNAWINCKFDGGTTAVDMQGDTTFFANCDFTNFTGNHTLISNSLNLISCNFFNNTNAKSTLYSISNNIEGCNFLDNKPLGSPVDGNPVQNFISNSTITGNAIVMPNAVAWRPNYATYVNSKLLSNPTFNKLLVQSINDVPTVLINIAPNPYPQFLVTQ